MLDCGEHKARKVPCEHTTDEQVGNWSITCWQTPLADRSAHERCKRAQENGYEPSGWCRCPCHRPLTDAEVREAIDSIVRTYTRDTHT